MRRISCKENMTYIDSKKNTGRIYLRNNLRSNITNLEKCTDDIKDTMRVIGTDMSGSPSGSGEGMSSACQIAAAALEKAIVTLRECLEISCRLDVSAEGGERDGGYRSDLW